MKARKQNRKPQYEQLTDTEHQARTHARRNGLYVLFEGSAPKRRWRIYDFNSGNLVAEYWPDSGRCNCYRPRLFTFDEKRHEKLFQTLAESKHV